MPTTSEPDPAIPLSRRDQTDPERCEERLRVVERVARDSASALGDEGDAFEEQFAAYCEIRYAVGMSSGTAALGLALRSLDVGRSHEVIAPANSQASPRRGVQLGND